MSTARNCDSCKLPLERFVLDKCEKTAHGKSFEVISGEKVIVDRSWHESCKSPCQVAFCDFCARSCRGVPASTVMSGVEWYNGEKWACYECVREQNLYYDVKKGDTYANDSDQ